MFKLFKKKTREQQVEDKTEKVFTMLTNDVEFEFTDLETVQILNNVRRKLSCHLQVKKADCLEQAVNYNQKANEIVNALKHIE